MIDIKTDELINKFMEKLDHSYKYNTSNERTVIEKEIRDIAESAITNVSEKYIDTDADGYVFCGKCGKIK